MTSARLSAAALRSLGTGVAVPAYDRSAITAGIVHFGTGAFVRSHQAMYLDRLLTAGEAAGWGICAVDVLASDRPKARFFAEQDGLYTIMVKHPDGTIEPRVIGSLAEYLFAPAAPEQVIGRLSDPRTRIVTLTITEGGYSLHPVTGQFDPQDPAVAHDLVPGSVPRSVFGFIIAALRRRRESGVPAFTIVSCDNLQGNGTLARSVFCAFAERYEPGLGDWIAANVAFPNSMVDRITPVTTAGDRARLRAEFGIEDAWPVVCEPFTQWVLEDQFPAGRPPWEHCGVQLVTDVTPYELMKLRLLNVSHQAMAYPGYLAGYRYAHETVADPVFAEFLTGYMQCEARPTLEPVPGVDLDDYIGTLMSRFGNEAVRDTLARLCAASSDRIPKWLLPVVRHNLATGGPVARSAAVVASWARYAEGTDEAGNPIEVVDALRDEVMARARRQEQEPLSFLRNEELFGDLAEEPRFAEAYLSALAALHRDGAADTLRQVNAGLTTPGGVAAALEAPERR
jgi:mannitol 2-dehydrogenase